LLGIVAFAVICALPRLTHSLSIDEPFTANIIQLPWPQFYEAFKQDNAIVPHYALLKVWASLFGESEVALRLPSLMFFCAAIVLIGLSGRKAFGWHGGLLAAALLASSIPLGTVYATNARPYAMVLFLMACAVWLGITLHLQPARRGWFLLVLTLCLGLLTHSIFLFFLAVCLVAVLLVGRQRLKLWVLCSAIAAAAYLVLMWDLLRATLQLPSLAWLAPPTVRDLAQAVLMLWGLPKTLLLVAVLAGLVLYRRTDLWQRLSPRMVIVALLAGLIGLGLPFVQSLVAKPVFFASRTPIIIFPAACLAVAYALHQLAPRWVQWAVVGLMGLGSLASVAQDFRAGDPWPARTSVQTVLAQTQCGDAIVAAGLSYSEVQYYLRRLNADECLQALPFPATVALHPGWVYVQGELQNATRLSAEAQSTAHQLAQKRAQHKRVFLFYDSGRDFGRPREVIDFAKQALDAQFGAPQTLHLRGSFFDAVLVYGN
jgi:mannosyltransferase